MRRLRLSDPGHDDPLEGMANLFDLGVVFALGFGIAILAQVSKHDLPRAVEALQKSPDEVPDQAAALKRYRSADDTMGGNGTRLGTAYRLADGDVVYVPETPP